MDTRGSILAYQYFRKSSTRVKQRNNILKVPVRERADGRSSKADTPGGREQTALKQNHQKDHSERGCKKCWDGQDVPSGPSLRYGPSGDSVRTSPLPKNQKDSAEGLLIFFKREDVFIYNGNTIEYHVCGPRWKNYTWKIDLNKT